MDLIYDIVVNLLSDGISFLLGTILAYLFLPLKKIKKVIKFITGSLFKKTILLGKYRENDTGQKLINFPSVD